MKETKRHILTRYILLLLFIIAYVYYTINKFGLSNGLSVSVLTWSFFVFCTPVADAGFLLAFPVRILIGVRMMYTQIFSFFLALAVTLMVLFYNPATFQKTLILKLYHQILFQPVPYWLIIFLSITGTIFSIYFGDELVDVGSHSERKKYHKHINKYRIIASFSVFILTVIVYNFLLKRIGVRIPLL